MIRCASRVFWCCFYVITSFRIHTGVQSEVEEEAARRIPFNGLLEIEEETQSDPRVFWIRHGESEANAAKGANVPNVDSNLDYADALLTERGKSMAQKAGAKLGEMRILAPRKTRPLILIVSPMLRTMQTAAHLLSGLFHEKGLEQAFADGSVQIYLDMQLRERNNPLLNAPGKGLAENLGTPWGQWGAKLGKAGDELTPLLNNVAQWLPLGADGATTWNQTCAREPNVPGAEKVDIEQFRFKTDNPSPTVEEKTEFRTKRQHLVDQIQHPFGRILADHMRKDIEDTKTAKGKSDVLFVTHIFFQYLVGEASTVNQLAKIGGETGKKQAFRYKKAKAVEETAQGGSRKMKKVMKKVWKLSPRVLNKKGYKLSTPFELHRFLGRHKPHYNYFSVAVWDPISEAAETSL